MSESAFGKEVQPDIQWYEDHIAIRGCQLTLPGIKAAYRELSHIASGEGARIVNSLKRPDGLSEEDFVKRNSFLKDDAFLLTVSVIGFDGQTAYGETESIFDSKNLPFPIRRIFFTNTTAYQRNSNGVDPPNHFSLWLHFDKPPIFDPNSVLSEPTVNGSGASIKADDVVFFRAVQNVVTSKFASNKKWYSFIHEKFSYDMVLWFFALPYALYWITVGADWLVPENSDQSSFRVAFFVYGMGISLLLFRGLFGYIKWAFPVNILEENKDRATRHRVVLGAILFGLTLSGIRSILSTFFGF